MRIETWKGLRVHIAGGSDREGGGDGPAVVLLHGYGAPGDDLAALWRVLRVPRGTRFVFPEAPLTLPQYGSLARAWWHIDIEAIQRAASSGQVRDRSREEPAGLAEAHAAVNELLDHVQERLSVSPQRLVLGGFSQGAMLSCDVALRGGRALAGLVLLSGTLICSEVWSAAASARRDLPVFQSHGRRDEILPWEGAVALRELWQQAGVTLDFVPFQGGHEIPPVVLQQLGEFLTRILDA